MRDVLMIALMVASMVVFAAYVAFCDRVIGIAEPGTDDAANATAVPSRRDRERAAS
jgi:hypothetical protein